MEHSKFTQHVLSYEKEFNFSEPSALKGDNDIPPILFLRFRLIGAVEFQLHSAERK